MKGIKAGTATITCTSVATGLSATCTVTVTASSASRSLEGDNDETTGINSVNAEANNGAYYNLQGIRVAQPTKGLYIVNGKKMLVK